MIFKILIRYILGFVNISVQGYYIERFINICISKNIFLWNVKIEKSTYMHANVGIKDFKKLKEVAKKTKCRIELNTRKGIPFFMNRYRKRKILLLRCNCSNNSNAYRVNVYMEYTNRRHK